MNNIDCRWSQSNLKPNFSGFGSMKRKAIERHKLKVLEGRIDIIEEYLKHNSYLKFIPFDKYKTRVEELDNE